MEIKIQCPGYEISTEWYEGKENKKILIVLPGYSSSKARQKIHAEAMVQDTGICALAVDFSGHGESPFSLDDTRPAQHLLELVCVYDWLHEQHPDASISISGSSYGGYLAAHLSKYRDLTHLILRAPAIYLPSAFYDPWSIRTNDVEAYAQMIKPYRTNMAELEKHPVFEQASKFKGRTLVVVHEIDEVVPRPTTDAFIKAFGADSILAQGFSHKVDDAVRDESRLQSYQDQITAWLNEV